MKLQINHVVRLEEVQRVPDLLPAIKRSVDIDRCPGLFLSIGSANLLSLPYVTASLVEWMEIAQLQSDQVEVDLVRQGTYGP